MLWSKETSLNLSRQERDFERAILFNIFRGYVNGIDGWIDIVHVCTYIYMFADIKSLFISHSTNVCVYVRLMLMCDAHNITRNSHSLALCLFYISLHSREPRKRKKFNSPLSFVHKNAL